MAEPLKQADLEAALTIKERVNYPYLLANAILTFQRAILDMEKSDIEIRESIMALVSIIPKLWKDEDFEAAEKEAQIIKHIDIRPVFCGIPASKEYCARAKLPIYKDEITYNYYKLFQACIDLLQRRGVLTRKVYVERFTGRKASPMAEILEELP